MLKWILLTLVGWNANAQVDRHFETLQQDRNFANTLETLDVNCSTCKMTYKNTGTSVGFKLEMDGHKIGKFVPKGTATNIEAQVLSYNLGRFLGMAELVVPSAYFDVNGAAVQTFKRMLQSARESNRDRITNRATTLETIARSPHAVPVVFIGYLKAGSLEARGIAQSNQINSSHPIARFIRADGPKPSASKMMTLEGVKLKNRPSPQASELELARQFSQIMVLDMLNGQWDRWSGGNVEAGIEGDRVFFVARDNGGAGVVGFAHMAKYKRTVTRFDQTQIERVKLLVDLLSGSERAELLEALGVRSAKNSLLERAQMVLDHVRHQQAEHGANAFF